MALNLDKILADWQTMETAFASGSIADGLHAAADLIDDAGDVADLFTTKPAPMTAAMKADPKVAACQACIARIQAVPPKAAAAVGAWGDGVMLKVILDALIAAFSKWFS